MYSDVPIGSFSDNTNKIFLLSDFSNVFHNELSLVEWLHSTNEYWFEQILSGLKRPEAPLLVLLLPALQDPRCRSHREHLPVDFVETPFESTSTMVVISK